MAVSTLTSNPSATGAKPWLRILLGSLLALLFFAASGAYFVDQRWPFRDRNMLPLLERVFASHIQIDHYRRIYLPHPGLVADGIILRRNSAPDLPPVGSVDHLRVEGRWIDLLFLRNRVRLVDVSGLHVVIPPVGSRANREDFPPGSSADFAGPSTIVEHLDITRSTLDILRSDGGLYRYPIERLLIGNLRMGQAISYSLDMQDAQPSGHIHSQGSFGPLLPNHLANTPLHGEFTFAPIRLQDLHGVTGLLSTRGSFKGTIANIETLAEGSTPDFAVGHGRPTSVSLQAAGAVNALTGDTEIHSMDVHTGATTLHVRGKIAGSPKIADLDVSVAHGRAQDILRPFLRGEPPVVGAVALHSHAHVAPPLHRESFLDRLTLFGAFDIPSERLTEQKAERSLTAFSLRAQGRPSPKPDEIAPSADVLSSIAGAAAIEKGIVHSRKLTFVVPGASIDLSGDFQLRNQDVHLLGDLHMQSSISHVTTGWKSFLLKPLAPFFRKGGDGAVVPIAITGSPKHYKISQNLLHNK